MRLKVTASRVSTLFYHKERKTARIVQTLEAVQSFGHAWKMYRTPDSPGKGWESTLAHAKFNTHNTVMHATVYCLRHPDLGKATTMVRLLYIDQKVDVFCMLLLFVAIASRRMQLLMDCYKRSTGPAAGGLFEISSTPFSSSSDSSAGSQRSSNICGVAPPLLGILYRPSRSSCTCMHGQLRFQLTAKAASMSSWSCSNQEPDQMWPSVSMNSDACCLGKVYRLLDVSGKGAGARSCNGNDPSMARLLGGCSRFLLTSRIRSGMCRHPCLESSMK